MGTQCINNKVNDCNFKSYALINVTISKIEQFETFESILYESDLLKLPTVTFDPANKQNITLDIKCILCPVILRHQHVFLRGTSHVYFHCKLNMNEEEIEFKQQASDDEFFNIESLSQPNNHCCWQLYCKHHNQVKFHEHITPCVMLQVKSIRCLIINSILEIL